MRARREASAWAKFRLMMWKHTLHQWRHPVQTAFELLLPVLTMSLILLLRWQIEPTFEEVRPYTPFSAEKITFNSLMILRRMHLEDMSIAYSPKSDVLEEVLRRAILNFILSNESDLIYAILEYNPGIQIPPDIDGGLENFWSSLIRIDAYSNSADLSDIYFQEEITHKVLAAVEFSDQLYGTTELPEKVSYSLRFPERQRMNAFFSRGGGIWRTESIFPSFELPGPRNKWSNMGGSDPGYMDEMFVQLQHFISTELISKITGTDVNGFNVDLQRYPHPAYFEDLAVEFLQALFPFFIVITFIYTTQNIARVVSLEKELQLKETLKIMGVPSWIHWTSWFCKQFIFLMFTIVLVTIILKVNWFTSEEGYSDYALFTNTPWSILFFFLSLYLACAIFFCFMISGFFSKGSTAALFTGVIWFLTYIPAALFTMDVNMSVGVQIFTCFSINTAMAYGFQLLLAKESTGGMRWGQFFSSSAIDDSRLTFGHVVIMLIVDCILYMLITLYLEQVLPGPFGTPKRWYFLFQKQFWCYNNKVSQAYDVRETDDIPEIPMEREPNGHAIGVKIENLSKVYGKNVAVNNLSLNIYEDQITVLLGHNGAGKSTTISMITGNVPITSGSITLAGYDVTMQMSQARNHIGLCPQHNVLYNELTVREHLEFFTRLKGYTGQELYDEIDSLITRLELQEKRDYKAGGLSGGQKRRLNVGIALCGSSRVVLLDEPTSGMDPSARRALWELLQKEKTGRTMILTTHFMDEADILGDRVAIMAHGQLQCVGSPYFLKQHYGVGYTLVVVKDKEFSLEACTSLLSSYIPNIEIKEDRGTEVRYILVSDYSDKFENMLNDMERNIDNIKFKNYGLEPTTLEDVFMAVGSDKAPVGSESGETDTTISEDGVLSEDFDVVSTERLNQSEQIVTGMRLLWQHVMAIWIKLWLVKIRSWGVLLLQLLVPILQINLMLGLFEFIMSVTPTIQSRALSFAEGYHRTESLLSFSGTNLTSFGALAKAAYELMVRGSDIETMQITVVEDQSIDQYYLERGDDPVEMFSMRRTVLAGATFDDDSVTAWFSNFAYHDLPSSLAAVHNALLKAVNPTAEISVNNHPLTVDYDNQGNIESMAAFMSLQLSAAIGNSMSIISAAYIMFYIKERSSRAKLLQKAAGIQPVVMWGAAAVFDWLWLMAISITIVLSCLAFGVIGLSTFSELGRMYLCIMVYGAAMLPFHYLASFFFNGPAIGFVLIYFVNVIVGMMGPQIVEVLSSPMLDTENAAIIMDTLLQFFPLYSLVASIRLLNQVGFTKHSCCDYMSAVLNIDECSLEYMCQNEFEACCIPENPYFMWEEPGILRYIVAMLGSAIVLWGLLMMIEYRIFQKIYTRKRQPPPLDYSQLDEDVVDEARHVQRSTNSSHNLVARSLSKYYGKFLAVDQVSFTVSESECFGLLGVNGAGKTTTFKMLMGDESISSGEAFVAGHSVKTNITQVHKNIGYCPQFDAVFPELTGRETLRVFGLLRGLDAQNISVRTVMLAQSLGFIQHLDKKVKAYSGGNKRKLSTAVALMGRTRMVFVDEPTTGVDPAAKRQVWRAIRGAKRSGRGVVLTSHSMEECEALCSRLTIMVSGRFQCIGTPQHLKNKFSEGFTLTIKLKVDGVADALKIYVENNFSSPKLMEEYQGLLTYYLPDPSISWSRMFGIMEIAKRDLDVEDYNISQTTLEQIFLQFTKYQGLPQSEIESVRL